MLEVTLRGTSIPSRKEFRNTRSRYNAKETRDKRPPGGPRDPNAHFNCLLPYHSGIGILDRLPSEIVPQSIKVGLVKSEKFHQKGSELPTHGILE